MKSSIYSTVANHRKASLSGLTQDGPVWHRALRFWCGERMTMSCGISKVILFTCRVFLAGCPPISLHSAITWFCSLLRENMKSAAEDRSSAVLQAKLAVGRQLTPPN